MSKKAECGVECQICGKIVRTEELINHLDTQHNMSIEGYENEFKGKVSEGKCGVCGKVFNVFSLRFLLNHVNKEHNMSLKEYYDEFFKQENDGHCKMCGKPTKYISFFDGYAVYCSSKCSSIDPVVREKTKNTNIERYGVASILQIPEIHEKGVKANQSPEANKKREKTCMERYGAPNPLASEEIQQKTKDTCVEKYGVENPFAAEPVKQKIAATNLEKHGAENPFASESIKAGIREKMNLEYGGVGAASPIIKQRMQDTCEERYGVKNPYQVEEFKVAGEETRQKNVEKFCIENDCIPLKDIKEKGKFIAEATSSLDIDILEYSKNTKFIYNKDIESILSEAKRLEKYHNSIVSTEPERKIEKYLNSIYDGDILIRTRDIISPLELDFFIPEKNLAIEFNGTYWHSIEGGTAKRYHLKKSLMCRELRIRLIHIYEFENFIEQLKKLKLLITENTDTYNKEDFNKNNLIINIPKPEAVYSDKFTVFGAGKLFN